MAKPRSHSDGEELRQLHARALLVLGHIAARADLRSLEAGFREGIDAAFRRGNLKGLRTANRDLDEWSESLEPEDRELLDLELRRRFGTDTRSSLEADVLAVERVLAEGHIESKEEYLKVRRYVDAGRGSPGSAAKLNQALGQYEAKLRDTT